MTILVNLLYLINLTQIVAENFTDIDTDTVVTKTNVINTIHSIDETDCDPESTKKLDKCPSSNRVAEGSFLTTASLITLAIVILIVLLVVGYLCYRKHSRAPPGIHEEESLT